MSTQRRWHFECPDCQYDDKEAGFLRTDDEIYCPMCWADSLHLVVLRRWKGNGDEITG